MNSKRVGIIIPNYNSWQDTLECLDSVFRLTKELIFDIIIVDNASTNNSINEIYEWSLNNYCKDNILIVNSNPVNIVKIEKEDENNKFLIIKNSVNLGFAAALNSGIQYCKDVNRKYDYLWFLNNDTIIDNNTLKELLDFSHLNPNIGLIGSTIMEYYRPNIIQVGGGSFYNALLTINKPFLSGKEINKIYENYDLRFNYICGASMFIPFNVIEKVGYFNEEYFLYYEELDYTKRMDNLGITIGWAKDSIVYHKGGGSAGSASLLNNHKSVLSEYYSNLSALKYSRRFYKKTFMIIFFNRFILKTIYFIKNKNFYLFKPLVSAYKNFIKSSL